MIKADIGVVGLAVMGENLIMNMESKGFTVAVFNRTTEKVTRFINGRAKNKNILGAYDLKELVGMLKKPRKVMLMVKAGGPVDAFIEKLIPLLDQGDIIVDGGNSYYLDTMRRVKHVEENGLLYIGTGVSGGEEGALLGPSIMPGGSSGAWRYVKPILQAIAARVDGEPCCDWVGEGGAGHFVKMVHNGIEYGDMQLICEAYALMKTYLDMDEEEMSGVFGEWNRGELESYLVEITRDILAFKENGALVLDRILDAAGQKGTGKWTCAASMEEDVPLTLISEAVYARFLSALKDERVAASKILSGPALKFNGNKKTFLKNIKDALYAAKIVSYTQGYALMKTAAETYGWDLKYGSIALMWRGGCIIRSAFLGKIKESFDKDPDLSNLMLAPFFKEKLKRAQAGLRRVVSKAVLAGIPLPAFSSALAYYDGYRSANLPANLLQAQRDYFGAHTYERVDRPRGEYHHTNWTGQGGDTSASTYDA